MTEVTQLLIAIAGLAVGTFAFRIAGPFLGNSSDESADGGAANTNEFTDSADREDSAPARKKSKRGLPPWLDSVMSRAAVVLLIAVVATTALTEGQGFAGISRPAGVLVGGVLAWLKVPFIVVILAAAAVAAGLRLLGVQ